MSTRLALALALVVLLALAAALLLLDDGGAASDGAAPLALDAAREAGERPAGAPAPLAGDALPRAPAGDHAAPTRLPAGDVTLTRVTGRVATRAGAPVSDARVLALLVPANPFAGMPTLTGQRATTNAEGRFELLGVPAHERLGVEVDAPGHATTRKEGFRVAPGETRDVGTVTVDPGLALTGVVNDELGEPLPDARVSVSDVEREIAGAAEDEALLAEAVTDERGRYRVPHLARRQYAITASAEGHATASAQVTFVLGQQIEEWTQDFVLERNVAELGGVVLGPEEQPVADARVTLAKRPTGAGNSWFRTSAMSDDGGRFHFPSLPEGRYDLTLEAAGWYLPSRRKLEAGRVDHELRVQPAIRITGELRSETTAPPASFRVRLRPDASTGAGLLPGAEHERAFDVPDAPGSFAFDGLKPGAYTFEVQAPGFALARGHQLVLGANQREAHVVIPLRTGGRVLGRVEPAPPGTRVELRDGEWDPGLSLEAAFPTPPLPGLAAAVDGEGAFVLEHVPAGVYVASAVPPSGPATHLREVTVQEGRDTLLGVVRLQRAGSVIGVVYDEQGAPAASARLTLSGADHFQQTTADGEGRYRFDGVPAGVVEITATPPGLWEALRAQARSEVRVDAEGESRLDLQLVPRAQGG